MRPHLIKMCRTRSRRINPPDLPFNEEKWWPYKVREDATRSLFTDAGAWEFIAECFENGAPIRLQPPSAKYNDFAYVMVESEAPDSRRIYMKVVLQPPNFDRLMGVSFHFENSW